MALSQIQKISLNAITAVLTLVRNGSHASSIGPILKPLYARLYPAVLVQPDGSTIRIKYQEPVEIINLPFDLNKLDEKERKRRLLKRQMSSKIDNKRANENEKIIDKSVKFDHKKYINLNRKR